MKIALAYQIPSPEVLVIRKALEGIGDVLGIQGDNPASHSSVYDLAVVAGPSKTCPLARRRILFVLGQTKHHLRADWDSVVVTSEKAQRIARGMFGYGCRMIVAPPPLTMLHIGRRRNAEKKAGLIHVSEGGVSLPTDCLAMRTWGYFPFNTEEALFSDLEFNTCVRAGMTGFYPDTMEDGYDIQVRRHLALGCPVVCRKDVEVIGPLVNLCQSLIAEKSMAQMRPFDCAGNEQEYISKVSVLIKEKKHV